MDRIGFGNFECLCWEEGLITGSWLCLWKMIRREVKRFAAFISIFILSEILRDVISRISRKFMNGIERKNGRIDTDRSGLHGCDLLKKERGKVSII